MPPHYNKIVAWFTGVYDHRLNEGKLNKPIPPVHASQSQDAAMPEAGSWVEFTKKTIENTFDDLVRGKSNLAAHSSGGLDSSPLAILAGRYAQQQGQTLHTFNWCAPIKGAPADHHEWEDARRLADEFGFEHHEIDLTPEICLSHLMDHDLINDGATMSLYENEVLKIAAGLDVKYIVSGFGGDELITSRGRIQPAKLIRQGKLLTAASEIMWATPTSHYSWPLSFAKQVFSNTRRAAQGPKPRFGNTKVRIRQRFLVDPTRTPDANPKPTSFDGIREMQHYYLQCGYLEERPISWGLMGQKHGIEYLFPFLQPEIVNLALNMPEKHFYKDGLARYTYRQAIAEIVPEWLLNKGKPPEEYRVKHLIRAKAQALKTPEVTEFVKNADSNIICMNQLISHLKQLESQDEPDIHITSACHDAIMAIRCEQRHAPSDYIEERT